MRSFVQAAPGTTRSCIGGHMENRNIDLGSSSAELLGSAPRQAEAGIVGERLLLWAGYAHAVQPPAAFPRHPVVPADLSGQPCASFVSPADPNYQALLAIINEGREKALAAPRVDMPGATRGNASVTKCTIVLPSRQTAFRGRRIPLGR